MGEEVRITAYDVRGSEEYDERVFEWEDGLPNVDDLMPLSQPLISSNLLSAFNISPEPHRSMTDVNRASQNTLSNLRTEFTRVDTSNHHNKVDEQIRTMDADPTPNSGSEIDGECDDPEARASKRQRLVWTPQLHKRFIEVVAHLGVKKAVPKTIMQLMNVEGLSRENVASHLQKYRLYLKRMHVPYPSQQMVPNSGSGSGYQYAGNK